MEAHARLILADSIQTAGLPDPWNKPGADIHHFTFEQLSIAEARLLTDRSAGRPLTADKQVFVIAAKSIGIEAQNALLKLFEEPPADTIFFLIVPYESIIIPTLRSRFVEKGKQKTESAGDSLAEEFVRMSYPERLDMIASAAKKDPASLQKLVARMGDLPDYILSKEAKRSLLVTERYIRNRGASRKMLVEELALSLKVKKS